MSQDSNPQFDTNLESIKKQTKVIYYKSSGPGGQRKNKRETAVRLHHIPSGLTAIATEQRSQSQNLGLALHRLKERLRQLNKKPRPRISTAEPLAVHERIFRTKKLRSEKKKLRKRVELSEEY